MSRTNKTLQIRFPFGMTLVLALVLIGLAFGAGEGLVHLQMVSQALPTPSLGFTSPRFDSLVVQADQTQQQYGKIDCLLVGSSVLLAGVKVPDFERAYQATTGKPIHCAIFYLIGLPTYFSGEFSRVLTRIYHPRLVIYGANTRDYVYSTYPSVPEIADSAWFRYYEGEFNMEGWLIDHLQSYRYFLNGRNWMKLPEPVAPTRVVWVNKPLDPQLESLELEQFGHYQVSPEALQGIADLGALNSQSVQVVVAEVPLHPTFNYYLPHGQQDQDRARQIVSDKARAVGLTFFPAVNLPALPDAYWLDRIHLRPQGVGAARYSEWLGKRIGTAVQQGEIRDPAQPLEPGK